MVISEVEELATQQGYKTLKFFNRKKEEMILEDIDLLTGLQEIRNHVVDGEYLDVPSGDQAPGGLLNGPDEDLKVDKGIDQEEVADLLEDAAEYINPQQDGKEEPEAPGGHEFNIQNDDESNNPENCDEILPEVGGAVICQEGGTKFPKGGPAC